MRLRIELFVDDLDTSIGFYAALGFAVERREHDCASLRWGDAVIGLGPIAKLPPTGPSPGFTQEQVAAARGAGVEIVLEVEDLDVAPRSRPCRRPRPRRGTHQPPLGHARLPPHRPRRLLPPHHPGSDPAAQLNEALAHAPHFI